MTGIPRALRGIALLAVLTPLGCESRSDSVAALVAALRLPDRPATHGSCTLDLITVAWFALQDADGRWVRPGVPVDPCGKPRIEVRDALSALPLTTVSSRTVGEITSPEAAAAGCSQAWADMIAVQARGGRTAAPSAGAPPPAGGSARVCVYRVDAAERGGGKPAGDFVAGARLTPQRWAALRRQLPDGHVTRERGTHDERTGTAAGPCTTDASRFAVLRPETTGEWYVELDGCHRVLPADGSGLAAASPALLGAIERAVA